MTLQTIAYKTASAAATLALVVAPWAALAQTGNYQSVTIYDNFYSPQNLTVAPGTTVTWYNAGAMNHTVTFDSLGITSSTIPPGGYFSYTFSVAGTHYYRCQFHQGMTGSVTVAGQTGNSLSGTVTQTGQNQIIINSITPVRTAGTADGTFQNGWQWIFDVSVPINEPDLAMRFDNWLMQNTNNTLPAANNMRFYSAQSSNAYNQATAIYITAPGTYSAEMNLTGNLGGAPAGMRRVQIAVEVRIPVGVQTGTYNTNFGILTTP